MFFSIQGEGRFVGVPSVFLRTFGCNFECKNFGQSRDPSKQVSSENMPYMTDPRADPDHPEAYRSIEELPVTPLGCDSSASWAAKYKHLQLTRSVDEVVEHVVGLTPDASGFGGANGRDIHLVITGGEPLLGWQKFYPELLGKLHREHGLVNVTFETNGTQKVRPELVEFFNQTPGIHVTWSTSPKLSISGEAQERALNPASLLTMNQVTNSHLYNKFVVRDETCIDEVDVFVDEYLKAGVRVDAVYCMPEGATVDQLSLTEQGVAEACLRRRYRYSPRLHCNLWNNLWGV
jgi:7-carboxy-7-deazaguanine synthase